MWKKANTQNPITMNAEEHGWNLENGRYAINWFDCSQLPPSIISDAQTESNDSVDSDEETALSQAASYSRDEYSDDDDHYD